VLIYIDRHVYYFGKVWRNEPYFNKYQTNRDGQIYGVDWRNLEEFPMNYRFIDMVKPVMDSLQIID